VNGKRIGVISLGCPKNLVDTEVMLGHLGRAGWTFVADPSEADVILVNTCSFIEPAREESIRTILEAAEHKRAGAVRRLVVAGCLVQRYGEELARELGEVDAFVGLDELDRIVERVEPERRAPARPASALPVVRDGRPAARTERWGASRYLYDDRTPRRLATPPGTAYLKIAEGCDHSCAFCAIPSFRGAFRSRRPESVVAEARRLASQGVRELNLIAQDSSAYGRDLGLRDGLAALLGELDAIEELAWIRVHYLYPNTITPGLVERMARARRVVPYVDLPLQHAHPAVLRRMRRGGSAASHLRLVARLREAMPEVALRSTFIVGFPGETEAEFASLLEFVERVRFRHLGVFTYSAEEGTSAAALADDVPEEIKRERRDRLMALQQPIAFAANASLVGRRLPVLVAGAHPETEHLLVGRTAEQAPEVDGQVLINDGWAWPGQLVEVEISEAAGYDLVGAIVSGAAA
jgi:ribosomal protein S12 methylthiotransferase